MGNNVSNIAYSFSNNLNLANKSKNIKYRNITYNTNSQNINTNSFSNLSNNNSVNNNYKLYLHNSNSWNWWKDNINSNTIYTDNSPKNIIRK